MGGRGVACVLTRKFTPALYGGSLRFIRCPPFLSAASQSTSRDKLYGKSAYFFFICLLCLNTSLLTPTHTHKNTYLGIFGSFIHFFFYSLFLFDDKFIQMRYKCLVCNGWTSNNSLLCVWWNEHCAAMKRLRISSVSSVTAIFVCVSVLKFTKGWIETNVPMKYFFYAFKTFVFVKPG